MYKSYNFSKIVYFLTYFPNLKLKSNNKLSVQQISLLKYLKHLKNIFELFKGHLLSNINPEE